jgi:cell division protein ZapA
MSNQAEAITIEVLDKEYTISCPPEEKQALLESARILNERLREVRGGGKVLGTERMAVMTALNGIHEYNLLQKAQAQLSADVDGTVRRLRGKINDAISRREPTEAID